MKLPATAICKAPLAGAWLRVGLLLLCLLALLWGGSARAAADSAQARGDLACLDCHGIQGTHKGQQIRFDPQDLEQGPHEGMECLDCHTDAEDELHKNLKPVDCLDCHTRHDASVADDAHLGVDCKACHMQAAGLLRDQQGRVSTMPAPPGGTSSIHRLVDASDENSCRRCHTAGNPVGASALLLPAKGLICMPCHTSTWSLGGVTQKIALGIFLVGMIGALGFWLSGATSAGAAAGNVLKAVFSPRLGAILGALVLDGLLQRRLWRISPLRGLIHCLIFLPFVVRFAWGMLALNWSLAAPEGGWVWAMLNPNNPLTALVFDLTGLLVLIGAALALLRRLAERGGAAQLPGLPGPDWLALGLILGIIVSGFVAQGLRIAMTGAPPGSQYAFVGYALSKLFAGGADLTMLYSYLWYLHAIISGAFVAYLPFSRMLHMILAPLVLAAGAAQKKH